jgi:hypothetical protein
MVNHILYNMQLTSNIHNMHNMQTAFQSENMQRNIQKNMQKT